LSRKGILESINQFKSYILKSNKELNEEALIINDGDIEKSVNYLIDLNLIIL